MAVVVNTNKSSKQKTVLPRNICVCVCVCGGGGGQENVVGNNTVRETLVQLENVYLSCS